MKRTSGMALGLILAFAPAAAHARANWIVFKTDAGAVAYEAASVRPTKSGGVTLLTGMYSPTPLEGGGGVTHSYLFADVTFRCTDRTYLPGIFVLYDETQKLVDQAEATDENWLPVDQNGLMAFVFPLVCEGATAEAPIEAGDLGSALNKMKEIAE